MSLVYRGWRAPAHETIPFRSLARRHAARAGGRAREERSREASRGSSALRLSAANVGRRYAGDRTLFATVSPGVVGTRHGSGEVRPQPSGDREARGRSHCTAQQHGGLADIRRVRPRPSRVDLVARAGHPCGLVRHAFDDRRAGRTPDRARGPTPAVGCPSAGARSSACWESRLPSCNGRTCRGSRWSSRCWPTRRR